MPPAPVPPPLRAPGERRVSASSRARFPGHHRRRALGDRARLRLFQRDLLGLAPLPGEARGLGLRGLARLGFAPQLLLAGLALALRLEGALLGGKALARQAPRLLLGRGPLPHRGGRARLGLGALARMALGFRSLTAARLGQCLGLFLGFFLAACLNCCFRFGPLALGDQARRLGLGLGARVRDAAQLGLGLLAFAREVQRAPLVDYAGLRRALGAALGRDARAQGLGFPVRLRNCCLAGGLLRRSAS